MFKIRLSPPSTGSNDLVEILGLNYEALGACICEDPIRKAICYTDLTWKSEGVGT